MFGLKHSTKTKKKIGLKTKEYMKNPEIALKHKIGIENFWNSEKSIIVRKKLGDLRREQSRKFLEKKNLEDPIIIKKCLFCNSKFESRNFYKKKYCKRECSFKHISQRIKNKEVIINYNTNKMYRNKILNVFQRNKRLIKIINENNFDNIIQKLINKKIIHKNFGIRKKQL